MGANFGSVENLSDSPDNPSYDPTIGSSNGNVFVTWTESTDDQSKIFFRGTTNTLSASSNSSHIILPVP
jgi:hypothetical protein